MSDVPEKWIIRCPLDHSTYEKFIQCDCNFGSAFEIWSLKEQQLSEKQKLLDEARNHIINILSCSSLSSESSKIYYNNEAKKFLSKLNKGEG